MRRTFAPRLTAALVALAASGCAAVRSSAYPTAPAAPRQRSPAVPVGVRATRDPAGGEELGVVEASARVGAAHLDVVLAELRGRTAELGGDLVRIDRFGARYETVTEPYTYDCGANETQWVTRTVSRPGPNGTSTMSTESSPVSTHVAKTCHGIRQVEVGTFTVVGRAFRTRSSP
jgi:hypothetical protein